MPFEKGTGFLQIVQNVLEEYEKKNPMTDMSKESDYLSDIMVEAQSIFWEKHPCSNRNEGVLFDSAHDMLIKGIRKIIKSKNAGGK